MENALAQEMIPNSINAMIVYGPFSNFHADVVLIILLFISTSFIKFNVKKKSIDDISKMVI